MIICLFVRISLSHIDKEGGISYIAYYTGGLYALHGSAMCQIRRAASVHTIRLL